MPELLQIRTFDFRFSVWANDISQRAEAYQETIAKKAVSNLEPSYELRFAPPAKLISITPSAELIPHDLAPNQPNEMAAKGHSRLIFDSPLFFENTQYQFEWIFFNEVTNAYLTHRSHRVNEAFRFSPKARISQVSMPPRLTGSINTGNDVGWLRLPLTFELNGEKHTQNIAFEVLPTKIAMYQDLPTMYHAIDKVYPLWRFSVATRTAQDVASSNQRGIFFPIMWLANFESLRERFEHSLKAICAAPHSLLQPTVASIKASKLKGPLPHKLAERLKQDFAAGHYDKRYLVKKKKLTFDTPENRFIKMAVSTSKRHLADFEHRLRRSNQAPEHQRLSELFLNELHGWQQPLQNVLSQSFFKEVGQYKVLQRESLVLQQKAGYSAVYRVWQELRRYLDAFGSQSSISMKSVAEIYEVWCFLCLKQILEQDLGFALDENDVAELKPNEFLEYSFRQHGTQGAFCFRRADGVKARLAHEPLFDKESEICSYLVSQRPDIVLEVTLPHSAGSDSSEDKRFIWLFDAKYRIKSENNVDYVPDDAINQMHRYRDALIRAPKYQPFKKSRPVFGAFALYPGFFDQSASSNPYATAIEEVGIGAFALLPSQSRHEQAERGYSGHQWLLDFLQNRIGTPPASQIREGSEIVYPLTDMTERLYVQEATRIPYYGMHQVLYSDLVMTVVLGGQCGYDNDDFERFRQGTAQWYHLPQDTSSQNIKRHIAEEVRYLALTYCAGTATSTAEIKELWPVKEIALLPGNEINKDQAGKELDPATLYYSFRLGKPLSLQTSVTEVPHPSVDGFMKFTTLSRLEKATTFTELEKVYEWEAV